MKILFKDIAPAGENNGNGSVLGGWIYSKMDNAALTIASDHWLHKIPNVAAVTNSAEIKYVRSIFANDYVEIWGEYVDASPAKVDIILKAYNRNGIKKDKEYGLCATAIFSFTLIDNDTRKIVRIPREIIDEIKG
jgi:acyl-CoA hydrolase